MKMAFLDNGVVETMVVTEEEDAESKSPMVGLTVVESVDAESSNDIDYFVELY